MSKKEIKTSRSSSGLLASATGVLLIMSLYLNGLTGRSGYGVKALRPWFGLTMFLCGALVIATLIVFMKKKANIIEIIFSMLVLLSLIALNFVSYAIGGY